MKSLIIYFSLEGNTRLIAEEIKKQLGADIVELVPERKYPSEGFKKYVWGGKSVVFKEKPKLLNEQINIDDYQMVFVGSPVWAGTYAAPFNTFFNEYEIKNKEIALFACHAGGGAEKCLKNCKDKFMENEIIGEIDGIDPLKDPETK